MEHTVKPLSKSVEVGRAESYFRAASSGKEHLVQSVVVITGRIRCSVSQNVWQPFSIQGWAMWDLPQVLYCGKAAADSI